MQRYVSATISRGEQITKTFQRRQALQNFCNHYYNSTSSATQQSSNNVEQIFPSEVRNFYKRLDHVTGTQMRSIIRKLYSLNFFYNSLFDIFLSVRTCALAALPVPRSFCTMNSISKEAGRIYPFPSCTSTINAFGPASIIEEGGRR